MKSVPNSRAMRRMQYAALPYRQRQDGEVQIRLITSRETRRWVIPKGWPMKGLTPAKAAAREAYEEAGLLGSIATEPLGLYSYDKRLALQTVPCDVMVFPLKVKRYLKKWPERSERFGFWFSIESAAAAVHEPDLGQLILDFGAMMAERFAQKRSRAPLAPSLVPADGEGVSGEDLPLVAGAVDLDAAGRDAGDVPAKAAKRRLKIPPKGPAKRPGKQARTDGAVVDPADGPAAPPKGAKAAKPKLAQPELATPETAAMADAPPQAGPETAGDVAAGDKVAKPKGAKPKVAKAKVAKAKTGNPKTGNPKTGNPNTSEPETEKPKAAKVKAAKTKAAKAKMAKPKAAKGKAQRAVPLEVDEDAQDAQGGWSAEDTRHLPQGLPFPPTRH